MLNKAFIEIDWRQLSERGGVSGDVCITKRGIDRTVLVVSDGSGTGIKANVIASVIASMAVSYSMSGEEPIRAAKSIVETFARGDHSQDVKQATFTIVTILDSGVVYIAEFENPPIVILREGKVLDIEKTKHLIKINEGIEICLITSQFVAMDEDRLVLYTDGVSQSGFATRRMPQGWGDEGVVKMVCNEVEHNPTISATQLARRVIYESELNDLFAVKNDICCATIYFRRPRRVLVCTGPPFDSNSDSFLAQSIREYDGEVIISGGTTAQIISRELGREIRVIMKRDPLGLPPASRMDGITLVTEGVLTLAKVKSLLKNLKTSDIKSKGIAAQFAKLLLEHDVIDFMVGNRINAIHQDPRLPAELELRRTVVGEIARILETKFMKKINIKYL